MDQIENRITLIPFKESQIDLCNNLFSTFKKNHFVTNSLHIMLDTLRFIYENYGKGIYVKIINNQIINFIAFKNMDFMGIDMINYWGIIDGDVIKNYEIDGDIMWFRDLLDYLSKFRSIPDCDFFLNLDHSLPIIDRDNGVYHTVLSLNTSNNFADFPIPNIEDWNRITNENFGIKNFKSVKWEDKNSEFLYRGYSTDSRVKFLRKVKLFNEIDINLFKRNYLVVDKNGKATEPLDFLEKIDNRIINPAKYKFIFALDGDGSPEELSTLMFTGSCIIRQDSVYKLWFDKYLIENVHYINLDNNFENLEEIIKWCKENESMCEKIGENARIFATKYLSTNGILDYMQKLLVESIKFGIVKFKDIPSTVLQCEYQKQYLFSNKYEILGKFSNLPIDCDLEEYENRFCWEFSNALSYLDVNESVTEIYYYDNIINGVNSAFIGMNCINELRKEIPNFQYTIDSFLDTNGTYCVVTEKINHAVTLRDFIASTEDFKIMCEIVLQIGMSLDLAYERFCFQHGCLTLENIIVQELKENINLIYNFADRGIWALSTKYIAIIIDYGNSKALVPMFEYKGENCPSKFLRMFSGKHDTISDLVKSDCLSDFNIFIKLIFSKKKYIDLKSKKSIFDAMKQVVKRSDIKNNNIKFGELPDIPQKKHRNVRYLIDKLLGLDRVTDRVYERIYKNPIPTEDTGVGNLILKYEMIHNIESVIGDCNINLKYKLQENKFKDLLSFIKKYYDNIISKTIDIIIELDDENYDGWSIKLILLKYSKFILQSKFAKKFQIVFNKFVFFTLNKSITNSVRNTVMFYNSLKENRIDNQANL